MNSHISIGNPGWSVDEIRSSLDEFSDLYSKRPIQDNQGGMKAPHMFAVWFMAKKLNPDIVVESGIWKGQSTWLLEQACPNARIIAIDINLSHREYISDNVEYHDQDFTRIDWSAITDRSLVFYDDHQNAYQRIQQSSWAGFKHIIFEDNYPSHHGDCYSIKKAFNHAGFINPSSHADVNQAGYMYKLLRRLANIININLDDLISLAKTKNIQPNEVDKKMLLKNLSVYYEFPPVYKPELTRWGEKWTDETYPTPPAVLKDTDNPNYQAFYDEATAYTWICYTKLK